MRFIVDANLPPALADWIRNAGHDASHISDLGLTTATDQQIWARARQDGACIVSKDEDFLILKTAEPNGPALVWVRIGNATRPHLLDRFAKSWKQVLRELAAGEGVIEIR